MKKIRLFATLLMATLALTSCGGDENDGIVDEGGSEVPNDGTIVLTNCAGGIYFGDFWDEGYGDYYFLLTNDTQIGQTEQGFDVPMTPGCYLLYIDVWGALSADHTNPIVPEGTYTLGDQRGMNVLTSDFTLLTENVEKVGEQFRIVDHYFSEGTVVVTHTAEGYKVEANFVTTEGVEIKFRYEGAITLEDKSDDEEFNPGVDENITINPVVASYFTYESTDTYDNVVLMLFTTEELTYDNMHVNEPGMKLHLDIYTQPQGGIAGSYTVGELNDKGMLENKEAGVIYPGKLYSTMALGSHIEVVNNDESMSVENGVIVDGTLTITDNGDGTHTIVGEFITAKETTVSCNWTGVVAPYVAPDFSEE